MKRVLLTGMSGTGKSSVVRELVARGYKAIDTDDGWCERQPDGRQLWRERSMEKLLSTDDAAVLFIAGCEKNQVKFYGQFDTIILLSAPLDVMVERLTTRTSNSYGKRPEELSRVHDDAATVEPQLRSRATHEVRTTMALPAVVAEVLRLVDA